MPALLASRHADGLGIEAVWVTDVRFLRDCYTLLGAIAVATNHIALARGVSDPFSRHPANLAAAAATLAELAPGRVILGLGAGGSGLDKIGAPRRDPVRTVEAAVAAIRGLLRGEHVSLNTAGFRLDGGKLAFTGPISVPIAIVAHGPVMYRVAGQVGDIAFIANYAIPDAISWARQHLDEGKREREAGLGSLDRIRFHDQRHAHASYLARTGVPAKVAQERPNYRIQDKGSSTTVRVFIVAEAFNNINGWNSLGPRASLNR